MIILCHIGSVEFNVLDQFYIPQKDDQVEFEGSLYKISKVITAFKKVLDNADVTMHVYLERLDGD